jgi:TonB-linked SusC/RagA family outer membrane protein
MAFVMFSAYAQEKVITGVVTDSQGLPIPGVNVVVQGEAQGVQTDFDGKYSISASAGEKLVFSFVGMISQTATVGTSNTISIQMRDDVKMLEEVVVNSYIGAQERTKVTGSVATVSSATIENSAFGSFDQTLQGQAPGITIMSGSGQPGTASKIRIRGTASINEGANSPLFILDGVPISPNDYQSLNQNDFASVSVLKDASATSIYGSRASAGVIVITTKRGAYNQKTEFTYRSQVGISKVGDPQFDMMNSSQLLRFQRLVNNGIGAGAANGELFGTPNGVPLTDAQIAELAQVNTNWKDVFFRTGVTQTHEFNMRGGSEKTRFFNSINYFEQEGIAERSDLQRFSFRSNLENKPSETSSIGYNISMNFSKQNVIDSEGGIFLQNPYAAAYLGSPYDAVYREDGSYNTGQRFVAGNAYENLIRNKNENFQVKVVGNLFAEAELFKNVSARVDFSVDYTNDNGVRGSRPSTYFGSTEERGQQGFYRQANQYEARFNTTTRVSYRNVFAEKHDVEVSVFTEYFKQHFKSGTFLGYGINEKLFGYPASITAGTADNNFIPQVGGSDLERGLFSYFATGRYVYDGKYTLDASIRRDASSRFSNANQWGTFWSVGANWNMKMESFLSSVDFITNLNLRASYGTTGNQAGIGDFQEFATWGSTSYGGVPGIVQTSVPNPQLQWEEGQKFNVGVDFDLYDHRVFGSVDFYNNITNKLLIDQRLPLESGLGVIDQNAGEMSNRGIDLSIEAVVLRNRENNLSLSFYANYNYNRNRIEDLGQVSEFIQGTAIVREGLPYGSHYAVGWAGVNPANGQPLYYDANGNVTTVYNEEDNSVARWGTSEPVYSGGFGHRFTYKGFDFSTLFTFFGKYDRYNNQTFFSENPNFAQYNQSTKMLTMWQNPGDITEVQSYQYNREFSSKDIEDASFIRFKNIQLGYTFSKKQLENLDFLSSVRFYLQGQNLATWTKFTGFDPEDSNNIATYEYPTPKIYTFGVDVKF